MSEYLNNEAEKVSIDNHSAVNNVSILDDKSDLNMIKIQELRNTLEESLNNFYSDRDCHRFLTKHNFNMQKCHEMICQHYQWYLNPVTSWEIENPKLSPRDMGLVEVDSKQNQFNSVYPCSFLGEDRQGQPIYWEKMGYIAANWGNLKKHFNSDELMARHIRQQEIMRARCRSASIRHGKIIDKQIIIKDMKGVPMFADWGSLMALKESGRVDDAYYPQTLKTMFFINTSIYFTALWNIVKPWFDPVSLEKVQILGDDYYQVLTKYISEDMIPAEYGGKRTDFSWTHPTNINE